MYSNSFCLSFRQSLSRSTTHRESSLYSLDSRSLLKVCWDKFHGNDGSGILAVIPAPSPFFKGGNVPSNKRGLRGVFPSLVKRGKGRFFKKYIFGSMTSGFRIPEVSGRNDGVEKALLTLIEGVQVWL